MARRLRIGCGIGIGVLAILLAVAGALVGLARLQTRGDSVESWRIEPELPYSSVDPHALLRVELDVSVAHLIVLPAKPGEALHVDAEFDERRYELVQETTGDAARGWTCRVRLAPRNSPLWELLKVKIGGPLAKLRVILPRGMPLELVGEIDSGFATIELGGLRVEAIELIVDQGAANISIWEPLEAPMDHIFVTGNKGALEISGLGNASPRTASFEQRLGPMELDFRGAWSRDAEIRIQGHISAGTVWLPDNAAVEGVERVPARISPAGEPEVALPTLHLDVSASPQQLLFIE